MPNDIDHALSAQRRTSKLLTAMAIFICLGIVAYMVLTLLVNRQTPQPRHPLHRHERRLGLLRQQRLERLPDDRGRHPRHRAGAGHRRQRPDSEDYQAVLLQRGTADSYEDFIDDSEADLKQAYGVIKPRKVNLTVEGAEVTAVRCDIQAYYAVLATITYDSGDVVYVSGLTKLASISDIVNLVESVSLS